VADLRFVHTACGRGTKHEAKLAFGQTLAVWRPGLAAGEFLLRLCVEIRLRRETTMSRIRLSFHDRVLNAEFLSPFCAFLALIG
jgi:hypothetical protein